MRYRSISPSAHISSLSVSYYVELKLEFPKRKLLATACKGQSQRSSFHCTFFSSSIRKQRHWMCSFSPGHHNTRWVTVRCNAAPFEALNNHDPFDFDSNENTNININCIYSFFSLANHIGKRQTAVFRCLCLRLHARFAVGSFITRKTNPHSSPPSNTPFLSWARCFSLF